MIGTVVPAVPMVPGGDTLRRAFPHLEKEGCCKSQPVTYSHVAPKAPLDAPTQKGESFPCFRAFFLVSAVLYQRPSLCVWHDSFMFCLPVRVDPVPSLAAKFVTTLRAFALLTVSGRNCARIEF